jgi:sugar phosphate isomerase/epimerase
MARALASEGIQLGMEFLGPKTLRNEKPYPFVHTMDGMLELNRDVGANAGLLLDCWHWWSSHSTVEALKKLKPEQVVYVHVSDAPLGIPEDEVIDNVRCLPGETGVIDIAGFLGTLNAIGYDGPVVAEPFKKELDQLPTDDDRLKTVKDSLDLIFRRAGLA